MEAAGAPARTDGPHPDAVAAEVAPRRAVGINFIYQYGSTFDNAKAMRDLGFRTTVPLVETFRRQIAWMESRGPIARAEDDPFQDLLIDAFESHARPAQSGCATSTPGATTSRSERDRRHRPASPASNIEPSRPPAVQRAQGAGPEKSHVRLELDGFGTARDRWLSRGDSAGTIVVPACNSSAMTGDSGVAADADFVTCTNETRAPVYQAGMQVTSHDGTLVLKLIKNTYTDGAGKVQMVPPPRATTRGPSRSTARRRASPSTDSRSTSAPSCRTTVTARPSSPA